MRLSLFKCQPTVKMLFRMKSGMYKFLLRCSVIYTDKLFFISSPCACELCCFSVSVTHLVEWTLRKSNIPKKTKNTNTICCVLHKFSLSYNSFLFSYFHLTPSCVSYYLKVPCGVFDCSAHYGTRFLWVNPHFICSHSCSCACRWCNTHSCRWLPIIQLIYR